MKVISKTKGGFLCDLERDEMRVIAKGSATADIDDKTLLGCDININEVFRRARNIENCKISEGYQNIRGLLEGILEDLTPIAQFSVDVTEINAGMTVNFTFLGIEGEGLNIFNWDFGDNSTNSTDRHPIHQYNTPGNYTVTLTKTDLNGDMDIIIKYEYIIVLEKALVISGYLFDWIIIFGITGLAILIKKKNSRIDSIGSDLI